jgi:hypothetical protein
LLSGGRTPHSQLSLALAVLAAASIESLLSVLTAQITDMLYAFNGI